MTVEMTIEMTVTLTLTMNVTLTLTLTLTLAPSQSDRRWKQLVAIDGALILAKSL